MGHFFLIKNVPQSAQRCLLPKESYAIVLWLSAIFFFMLTTGEGNNKLKFTVLVSHCFLYSYWIKIVACKTFLLGVINPLRIYIITCITATPFLIHGPPQRHPHTTSTLLSNDFHLFFFWLPPPPRKDV